MEVEFVNWETKGLENAKKENLQMLGQLKDPMPLNCVILTVFFFKVIKLVS